MSDRLAEIEALARSRDDWVYHDDVLALVEIAKAARDITESIAEAEGFRYVGSEDDIDMLDALARALARLDRPSSDGTADSGASRSGTDTAEGDA